MAIGKDRKGTRIVGIEVHWVGTMLGKMGSNCKSKESDTRSLVLDELCMMNVCCNYQCGATGVYSSVFSGSFRIVSRASVRTVGVGFVTACHVGVSKIGPQACFKRQAQVFHRDIGYPYDCVSDFW